MEDSYVRISQTDENLFMGDYSISLDVRIFYQNTDSDSKHIIFKYDYNNILKLTGDKLKYLI